MGRENIEFIQPRKRDSVIESRVYELTPYEKDGIRQIRDILNAGYKDIDMIKGHLSYLNHLLMKLYEIIEVEKSVNAPTLSLERDIKNVMELLHEVEKAKQNFIEKK